MSAATQRDVELEVHLGTKACCLHFGEKSKRQETHRSKATGEQMEMKAEGEEARPAGSATNFFFCQCSFHRPLAEHEHQASTNVETRVSNTAEYEY